MLKEIIDNDTSNSCFISVFALKVRTFYYYRTEQEIPGDVNWEEIWQAQSMIKPLGLK